MASTLNNRIHPKHDIINYEKWFVDHIDPNWTVLDIGCNTGILSWQLAQKAAIVYGIELIEDHIKTAEKARSKHNIKYICADANSFDYSNCNKIDCIVMSNVLEHIQNRITFLTNLIIQIKKINQNQIHFLFRVPMIDRDWITIYKKQRGVEYRLDPSHYIEYTLDSFTEEMKSAGLIIQHYHVSFGELYAICYYNSF